MFRDASCISDHSGNLFLEFVDYRFDSEPKYDIMECKERDANYAVPLRVKVRLKNMETGENINYSFDNIENFLEKQIF